MLQETRDAALGVLPFFHSYGFFASLMCIADKRKIVVVKQFDEHIFLSFIEKYKVAFLPIVPPLAVWLIKTPLLDKYDLSCIRGVVLGAAPLSKDTEQKLKQR